MQYRSMETYGNAAPIIDRNYRDLDKPVYDFAYNSRTYEIVAGKDRSCLGRIGILCKGKRVSKEEKNKERENKRT